MRAATALARPRPRKSADQQAFVKRSESDAVREKIPDLVEHLHRVGLDRRIELGGAVGIQSRDRETGGDFSGQSSKPRSIERVNFERPHRSVAESVAVDRREQVSPRLIVGYQQLARGLDRRHEVLGRGTLGVAAEDPVATQIQTGNTGPQRIVGSHAPETPLEHAIDHGTKCRVPPKQFGNRNRDGRVGKSIHVFEDPASDIG
jgi:hypothetical protein